MHKFKVGDKVMAARDLAAAYLGGPLPMNVEATVISVEPRWVICQWENSQMPLGRCYAHEGLQPSWLNKLELI